MRFGNKLGIAGCVMLVVTVVTLSATNLDAHHGFLSIALQYSSMILFLFAGFLGSRWWFAIPIVAAAYFVWLLSQGH